MCVTHCLGGATHHDESADGPSQADQYAGQDDRLVGGRQRKLCDDDGQQRRVAPSLRNVIPATRRVTTAKATADPGPAGGDSVRHWPPGIPKTSTTPDRCSMRPEKREKRDGNQLFTEAYSQPSSSAPRLGVSLAATPSVNKPHCFHCLAAGVNSRYMVKPANPSPISSTNIS